MKKVCGKKYYLLLKYGLFLLNMIDIIGVIVKTGWGNG